MNNLIKRILAYIIDMLIVMLIVQSLSGVSFINKELNKYNKYYKEYITLATNYTEIKTNLSKYYQDNKISEKEYQKILENKEYKDIISKYYEDNKITEKEITKINNQIDKKFNKNYKNIYYNVEKYSKTYMIIYILTIIGYFIVFNIITDGRTLGKRITKLKIVNKNNNSATIKNYLIRSLFLYQFVYYILRLIFINTLDINSYFNISNLVSNIGLFIEIAIILMVSIRVDERGLHDLISGTKVVNVDKNGNIKENEKALTRKKLKNKEEK